MGIVLLVFSGQLSFKLKCQLISVPSNKQLYFIWESRSLYVWKCLLC